MPIVTLRDLYAADLSDLWDTEQQILLELPAMAARATSGDLRQVFEDHLEQTRVHIERLALLFRRLDEAPGGSPCEAIRGLIQDGRRRGGDTERGEVLDAALIAAAQRIEHFEIAAYGCARTYARTLGDGEAAHLLQQTLEEEGSADHRLTRIAEHGINQAAGADLVEAATTYRSRLRYAAAGDLREFSYREYRVSNQDAEDLGALDGLIVDDRTGLPVYLVVDSGGWFAGRRYVVPVSAVKPDDAAHVLRTELTRTALRRYPEFNASAFIAMDDIDARNYEQRLIDAAAPRSDNSVPRSEDGVPPSEPGVPRGENGAVHNDDERARTQEEQPDTGLSSPTVERPATPTSGSKAEEPAPRLERYRER